MYSNVDPNHFLTRYSLQKTSPMTPEWNPNPDLLKLRRGPDMKECACPGIKDFQYCKSSDREMQR